MSKETAQAVKASPQCARLRDAESEETWISGEELNTDGSSDEDSCRCKNSPSKDSAKGSSAALARRARARVRLRGEAPISRSPGESPEAPRGQRPAADSRDASESDDDGDEISWKANREEEIMIENEMVAIETSRKEYLKICDSEGSLFNMYLEQIIESEKVNNEIFEERKEKIKIDLMNSIQFLNTTMDKIMSKVEQIKKKTRHIQLQNRMRLNEILKNSPTPSAKLAENTKKFFDLYPDKGLFDTSDSCRTENSKDIVKSYISERKFENNKNTCQSNSNKEI